MEQLGISLGYLISQLINFGLLAALLTVLLYKPILRVLHERQERIARSLADVDAARESAAKAQQEYDRRIAEAQRKAQEIIGQAAQTGEQVSAEIKAEAQREAEAIRQRAREEAAQERERVFAEVQDQIASISLLATERLLGRELDSNAQRRLIDQFLTELDGMKSGQDSKS